MVEGRNEVLFVAGVAVGVEPEAAPNPKLGVADVLEEGAPPKRVLGLLAGVLDGPPPKRLEELVAVLAVPKRPVLGALEVVLLAEPKRLGVVPPDELGAAPNSGLLGVLLLLFWLKLKAMVAATARVGAITLEAGWSW